MKELHNIGWYANKISPKLPKNAFKPVPSRLFGGLAYTIIIICGILTITLCRFNNIINFLISLVLGFSFASIGFLGHEILHGTVVKTHWLKNLLGGIAFLPLSIGPNLWIKWHNMSHHANTQHEINDPDAWMSFEQFSNRSFIKYIYKLPLWFRSLFSFSALSISFTLHGTRMFFIYVKEFKRQKSIKLWIQFILPWIIWIGLFFLVETDKWIFSYLLPFLIGNFIVMCYISSNHRLNPLVPINDPLVNSLSVTVPKWLDVLHFNFSYHTEHHLFPGMNPKYYSLVKEEILKLWPDRYHQMPLLSALKLLLKTPRIYYNNEELIDPRNKRIYTSLEKGLKPNKISYHNL
ncbi:fatty acid desaturase family protein [Clostridium beijerinckii]|uniref:fatty acid desaturase family protein n=1 Tax=Clostridium beijerinckii TaxID=1520 RepID=UPI00098BF0CC|nr:fatty acid desaturase [Clostridium beijerinckii]NRT75682.1 fatty acid desaturase [Clostridium beijerinckii]OOM44645.1 fatty acid desaturase [Clostridium beijerinckii]